MITLYHSPFSRGSRVVALVHALGAADKVEIVPVSILRNDGTGAVDPKNPHPEGKVPVLIHDGVEIWESSAIITYLTELFPQAGLGVAIGTPQRGAFLSWMAWYGDVVEPVVINQILGISHPALPKTYRTMAEIADRLSGALAKGPYLMGDSYTAADLLHASTFLWMPSATPDVPAIRDWVARCAAKPWVARANAYDAELQAGTAAA